MNKWDCHARYEFAVQWQNTGDTAQWRYWNPHSGWQPFPTVTRCLVKQWYKLTLKGEITDTGQVHYISFTIDAGITKEDILLNTTLPPVGTPANEPNRLGIAVQLDGNSTGDAFEVFIDDVRFIRKSGPRFCPEPFLAVNYYARDHAWLDFWNDWPATLESMRRDMPAIKSLGANTVRMFVHPAAFGWPGVPNETQLARIDEALSALDQSQLRTRLCLFDCWADFTMINESTAWMEAIMRRFRDDRRIALWELKNEVDLSNEGDPSGDVGRWVPAVFSDFKRLAGSKPVSITISAAANKKDTWRKTLAQLVDLLKPTPPDYYDVHFFPSGDIVWTSLIKNDILDAVNIVGGPGRLLVHEVGQTTFGEPSEAQQRDALQTVFYFARAAGIRHLGVWAYQDFPGGIKICGAPAPESELGFGLYRPDGTPKPAVDAVRDVFNGFPPASPASPVVYNASFEDADNKNGVLESWRSWRSDTYSGGELVRDSARFRGGTSSARLTTIARDTSPAGVAAGFFQIPAWQVAPGQTVTAVGHVWVGELPAGSTVRLVASWHDKDAVYLNRDTAGDAVTADPAVAPGWRPLLLTAMTPNGAAYMQLFVQVSCPSSGRFAWFDDFSLHLDA
jgi:hypothetical protein